MVAGRQAELDLPPDQRGPVNSARDIERMIADQQQRLLAARSEAIARTESLRIVTQARSEATRQSMRATGQRADLSGKEWASSHDARTRQAHQDRDGARRRLNEAFAPGIQQPGDGGPAEAINCRCTLLYEFRHGSRAGRLAARWNMTDLEKIEKRKGRWVRAATGEPLTVDELHTAYYLHAVLFPGDAAMQAKLSFEFLCLSESELADYVRWMVVDPEPGLCTSLLWLEAFAKWKVGQPPPKAADRARQKWKGQPQTVTLSTDPEVLATSRKLRRPPT